MTGPLAASWPSSSGGADAVAVAAVAELAVELVDEVAAVGEDQDAAGARGLDEAERRDRLAGAGRVLEPEPPVGVRDPRAARRAGRPRPASSARPASPAAPRPRPRPRPRLVVLASRRPGVVVLVATRRASQRSAELGSAVDRCGVAAPLLPLRCASASSAVSVPESASTWWADSTVPSTRCGSSSDSSRSSPSSSEYFRRHSIEGTLRPASTSASAASSARRRAEPGASASSSVSPS